MQSTSFLANREPLDALCHHFSLAKASFPANTPLPSTLDMHLIAPASRLPTHILAILPAEDKPHVPPLLVPVDAFLYHQTFDSAAFVPQLPPGTPPPTPHLDPASQRPALALPVVPVHAPHALSLPLLLLFGAGLETDSNLLAARILPPDVIGEFPNAAAMATVMSRLPEGPFQFYLMLNHGLWKNTLALAPRDTALVELVRITYKVVADARRLRMRRW
ncbi:hypothetical protein GGX14DRAFT_562041 [Mycena pura]|uniref:Uncharacterized protein n=1 Tax=Mycena pura TaxID=153505 RepID=A0AAD6VQG0_9AGAR|nr:hypothetical protein GGX14DRAFT_562041 [Mycena pura]